MFKNKTANRWYSISSMVLIITGAAFILYEPIVNNWIIPRHLAKMYETNLGAEGIRQNVIAINTQREETITRNFDFSEVENLDAFDITASIQTENVIGGIYIPSTGINLPILHGATNENLKVASATLKPDQVMGEGNYAIAAHNSRNPDKMFGSLRYVELGDEMYITDKNKVYKYTMVHQEVVMPERVDVIEDVENKTLLTLVSCYSWDGSDRLIVTGELTEVIEYTDAEQEIYDVFQPL
ncbi:class A sortase [Paenibacillus oralis]|uniref:class A sortase n=1 Tax=Paenibacillus oralis TaxID=2490856 RepID=UPI0015AB7F80|nr:class A sortase [Paenibacillus oralis]